MKRLAVVVGLLAGLLFTSRSARAEKPGPVVETATCDRATKWVEAFDTNLKAAQVERNCGSGRVLCLGPHLSPRELDIGDDAPREVDRGGVFTVVVFTSTLSAAEYRVASTTRSSPDTLLPAADKAKPPATVTEQDKAKPEPCSKITAFRERLLAVDSKLAPLAENADATAWSAFLAKPDFDTAAVKQIATNINVEDADYLVVDASSKVDNVQRASESYEIPVNRGRYYVDVGVMVAAVHQGERTYYEVNPLGAGNRTIGLERDTLISTAVMIEAFPFGGRRRSNFWFWKDSCPACALVGIQAGTGVTAPGREWFFGGVLEPIAGIGVGAGLALVRGQYLPQGIDSDSVIPPGQHLETRELFMPRFYFSLSASLEVLESARKAAAEIRK